MLQERQQQLANWAGRCLSIPSPTLDSVSGDASFRRYFRLQHDNHSLIAVDAPPEHENNEAFWQVAKLLRAHNLNVPEFIHVNLNDGFLLLSDLGDRLYLPELNNETADFYYTQAIRSIIAMQKIPPEKTAPLPKYDREMLLIELHLFTDWFIHRHLQLQLDTSENQIINKVFECLLDSAEEQPQVFVHRDYHSRNLMICDQQTPGIIDFQDAVVGPISYDLVSLIKDCYIRWPSERVEHWTKHYYQIAREQNLLSDDFMLFKRQFDWMGMQRHLKVLGIFCRLNYRDNKPSYLADLPLTFDYLAEAVAIYPEFNAFSQLLQHRIYPAMVNSQ